MRKHLAAALLFAALSVAMTWPLAREIRTAIAHPGDPYINTWILDWDYHATFHHPLRLFHGNVFHPAKYTLAYSENLYGLAVLLFPFRALGMAPLTAHNFAMLLGYAFCGFAAYALGWMLSGSWWGGVAAGIFYAFVPFRFSHASHVQHVWGGWLPMLLAALVFFVRQPSWRRAALFGGAFLINGLTNIHLLFFGTFSVGVAALVLIRDRRAALRLIVATLVAAALLAPFLYPYWKVSKIYGMVRPENETRDYSAELRDWLVASLHNRTYRRMIDVTVNPERWLFPGFLSIALAIGGAFVAARRDRRTLSIALLWIAIGIAGSLGLHFFFHRLLFDYVPGWRSIRVPARWASVAYVGLAMLIAFAVPRRRWPVGAVIAILFVVELHAVPIRWYQALAETPAVYRWLAAAPVRGATLEMPLEVSGSEYLAMYRATAHHRPIVNGTCGFTVPHYAEISTMASQSPIDPKLVDALLRLGTQYLIVHADTLGPRKDDTIAWLRTEVAAGRLAFVRRFHAGMDGDWLFELGRPGPRPPELEAFLAGKRTPTDGTFGILDDPPPGADLPGKAWFSGWALSPYGIRKVEILVNNGGIRLPTTLIAEPALKAQFPWYDATPKPRFVAGFDQRPKGVWLDTDVQVEITDGRGEVTLLEDRWITWK